MARCPFATWKPIGKGQSYTGGPFRIVHHTTEGSTAAGAIRTFQANNDPPHFTVDATTIFQHIDTGLASKALRHKGSPQTNRLSAVQIEVVGFAGTPKNPATLANVARLCRWIEETHGVPRVWPNGLPKPAVHGADPGGHNRNAQTWAAKGGHYGHCHVPQNTHWDPAYTASEVAIVMGPGFVTEPAPKRWGTVDVADGDTLSVRAAPSSKGKWLSELTDGEEVEILAERRVGSYTWYQIDGGWVFGRYLTVG